MKNRYIYILCDIFMKDSDSIFNVDAIQFLI